MKKILFILDEFYPTRSAPSVRINSFINEFKDFKITIVGGIGKTNGKKPFNYYNLNLYGVYRPPEKDFFSFIIFLIKINIKYLYLAKKNFHDVIILSIPKYEMLFLFPFIKKNTKLLVLDIRDSINFLNYDVYFSHFLPYKLASIIGNTTKNLIEKIHHNSIKKADLVTVANEGILKYVKALKYDNKVILISNGVDTKLFKPIKKRNEYKKFNIVYQGNFSEKDKFDLIYETIPRFHNKILLHLIGEGRNKDKIIKKLKELNIEFIDHGAINHKYLPELLKNMHFGFIFREKNVDESIPVSIYEFCSMNIITFVNAVGIMADLVKKYNLGFVINDSKSFSNILKNFVKNHRLLDKYSNLNLIAKKEFSRNDQAKKLKKEVLSRL